MKTKGEESIFDLTASFEQMADTFPGQLKLLEKYIGVNSDRKSPGKIN